MEKTPLPLPHTPPPQKKKKQKKKALSLFSLGSTPTTLTQNLLKYNYNTISNFQKFFNSSLSETFSVNVTWSKFVNQGLIMVAVVSSSQSCTYPRSCFSCSSELQF